MPRRGIQFLVSGVVFAVAAAFVDAPPALFAQTAPAKKAPARPAPAGKTPAAAARPPGASKVSKKVPSDKDFDEFGAKLAAAINAGDEEALKQLFDWDLVLAKTIKGLNLNDEMRDGYLKEMKSLLSNQQNPFRQVGQLVAAGGSYSYLRPQKSGNHKTALFRFLQASTEVNYHFILLEQNANGEWVGADLLPMTSGEFVSMTFRRSLVPLLALRDPNLPDKLTDADKEIVQLAENVGEISKAIAAEDYARALAVYDKLPRSLQLVKPTQLLRIHAARKRDPKIHAEALQDFKKTYPDDPCSDFLSIDYYASTGQFAEAAAAVARTDKLLGGDAYLKTQRATLLASSKDFAAARQAAEEAIAADPTFANAYFAAMKVALAEKDFDRLATIFDSVEGRFGPIYRALANQPVMAEFANSAPGQAWIAAHPIAESSLASTADAGDIDAPKSDSAKPKSSAQTMVAPKAAKSAALPSDKACAAFGKTFVAAIKSNDQETLKKLFDWQGMFALAIDGIPMKDDFRQGFIQGVSQNIDSDDMNPFRLFSAEVSRGGRIRYLRSIKHRGGKAAVFRALFDGDSVKYFLILLQPSANGNCVGIDLENFEEAQSMQYAIRAAAIPYALTKNPQTADKLTPIELLSVKHAQELAQLRAAVLQAKNEKALAIYGKLPAELQLERAAMTSWLIAAKNHDCDLFVAALDEYLQQFPNDAVADFISLDFYANQGQFDQALQALDRVRKQLGDDAYLQVIRANLQRRRKDLVAARKAADIARKAEPSLIEANWAAAEIALEEKNYAEVASQLKLIEKQSQNDVSSRLERPAYAAFLASAAGKPWRTPRAAGDAAEPPAAASSPKATKAASNSAQGS